MTSIRIQALADDSTELHLHYRGQTSPQRVWLSLHCETGELCCYPDGEIGPSTPFDVYHGRRMRWGIPALRAEAANALMERVEGLAQEIVAGYETRFDGSNRVGRLNETARNAADAIASICFDLDSADAIAIWEADEYFATQSDADNASSLGISAATTDDEIDAIAARELVRALGADGVDDIVGIDDYLRGLRDRAREDLARLAERMSAEDADECLDAWRSPDGRTTEHWDRDAVEGVAADMDLVFAWPSSDGECALLRALLDREYDREALAYVEAESAADEADAAE